MAKPGSTGRDFFGWEKTSPRRTAESSPILRGLPVEGMMELRKGDPDDGGLRVLVCMVRGGDGPDAMEPADPEIIEAYAQRECVLEELRQDGIDLGGNNDEMTRKAVTELVRKGETDKALVVAQYREEQIARTAKAARARNTADMIEQAEATVAAEGK